MKVSVDKSDNIKTVVAYKTCEYLALGRIGHARIHNGCMECQLIPYKISVDSEKIEFEAMDFHILTYRSFLVEKYSSSNQSDT